VNSGRFTWAIEITCRRLTIVAAPGSYDCL
jgi:hypothetical protein